MRVILNVASLVLAGFRLALAPFGRVIMPVDQVVYAGTHP